MPELNEGAGNGDEGAGKGDEGVAKVDPNIEILTKTVGLLSQGFTEMQNNQAQFKELLEKIGASAGKADDKTPAKDPFEGIDLDSLTQKDLTQLMMTRFGEVLEAKLQAITGDMDKKVTDLAGRFESKNATEQIEKTAGNNADFWEWSTEIKAQLKETPNLSVDKAYKLARAENPEKVEKLRAKYDKPAEKKSNLFSLTPTSSKQVGTAKMSQSEAAEKAFDEVMADFSKAVSGSKVA